MIKTLSRSLPVDDDEQSNSIIYIYFNLECLKKELAYLMPQAIARNTTYNKTSKQ